MKNQKLLFMCCDVVSPHRLFRVALSLALFFGLSAWLQAANVTSAVQQGAGNSWNNIPSIWSDNANPAVSAGNTYQLIAGGGPSRTRNPVLGSGLVTTFAGDSLTIDPGQQIRWKGPGTPGTIINFPGVGGNPGLICNGCLMDVGDSPMAATVQGKVQFLGNSILNGAVADRVQVYEADVSGSGDITIQGTGTTIPHEFKSANNTYSGTWTVSGGWLKGTGTNSLGTNSITMASGTILEYNYDGKCFGTITLNGTAQMKLHSYVQVVAITVAGTPVPAGLYTWAQANAAFPANFPAGGSGGIRVGSAPIDAIVQDFGTTYVAWEAENKVTIINNNPATAQWSLFADPTASGGYSLIESNIAEANNNLVSTSKWSLIFRAAGTYQMYIKYKLGANGGSTGNNSYRIPADFGPTPTLRVTRANNNPFGAPTTYVVLKEAEQNGGPQALFTVSAGMLNVPQDFVIGNRECPGFSIDRIVLSQDTAIPENTDTATFDGLINSSGGSQSLPAPRVLSVDSRLNPNGLQVRFANAVNATGLNPANYTLNNGVTVSGAAYAVGQPGSNVVQLTTTALTPLTTYTVTVTGVQNLQGLVQDPNPTNAVFTHYAGLVGPAGLQVNIYNGANTLALVKTAVANCTVPNFSANDTNVAMEYSSQQSTVANGNTFNRPFAGNGDENYGTKIFGVFVAPTTGNYQFALSSDDQSELYLSTDASPANKVLLTSQGAWNGYRGFISGNGNPAPGLPIPRALVAGRSYYMEVLHQEGGGGDHVSVAVSKPGDPAIADNMLPIPRSLFSTNYSIGCPPIGFFSVLGPVVQTVAPANQTVVELFNATFFMGIDGIPPYNIQWYSNNVPIPNATNVVYAFNPLRYANGAQYKAIVQNDFSSVTSSVATLTVISDLISPTLLSAVGGADRLNASVVFSEAMLLPGATNIANYTITNAAGATLAVTSAKISPDGLVVTLTTAAQTSGAPYWVVVNNLTDRAGVPNVITPNPSVASFVATDLDLLAGKVLYRAYPAGAGNAVSDLINHPSYPDSPDFTQLINGFNTRLASDPLNPTFYSGDGRENYGGTLVGHFIPPSSGNWIFYTLADDASRLFMNTNGASSVGKVQLLDILGCCGAFTDHVTPPIKLIAGQAYYMEGLYKEGGGGDLMQIAARLQGDNSALAPIPQSQVGFASKLTITQQPTNITVVQNHNATFTLVTTVGGAGNAQYQWQRSTDTTGATFTNIPGATASSYTLFATTPDDQFQFRCEARLIITTNLSSAATLTVLADVVPPTLVSITSSPLLNSVTLTWSEVIDPTLATDPFNYALTDPLANILDFDTLTITTVGDHSVVLLHLSPLNPFFSPDTTYDLGIYNQLDLVANPAGDIATNFHTFPLSHVLGQLFREEYNGIGGTAITDITNNPAYLANNPSTFDMLTSFDTGGDHADNYGARVSGYLVPTETANYTFQFISDDAGYVNLSTDETRANATLLALESPGCCANIFSATRTLEAGKVYFVEGVYKEGGGGDYMRLSWKNNASIGSYTIIPSANLAYLYSLTITAQPVNTTVDPNANTNTVANFSVTAVAGGAAQAIKYQWQKSLDGGLTYNPVAGATGRTLAYPAILGDNGAKFRCEVRLLGNFQTNLSDAATLTLLPDNISPIALSAHGVRTLNAVKVKFSEVVASGTATDPANYSVSDSNGPVVIGAVVLDGAGTTVTISIPSHAPGVVYTVDVSGVTDPSGNVMVPATFTIQSWIWSRGFAVADYYLNINGGLVSDLTNSPAYPNGPDFTEYVSLLEGRSNFADNYGNRISGRVRAPLTGNYDLYIGSDDEGILYLSTDLDPANRVQIATEPQWSGGREFVYPSGDCCGRPGNYRTNNPPYLPVNIASNVALVAGTSYYIEALQKEGGGGDNVSVAWHYPGGPEIVNGSEPLHGTFLSALADPVGATITLVQQPSGSTNVNPGQTVTMNVAAVGTNVDGSTPVTYQWQLNGVDILGANGTSYTTPPLVAGDCGQYRVLVFIPGASTTTTAETVGGPSVLTIVADSATTAIITWGNCGILQSATDVTGPWTDVLGATSPRSVNTATGVKFYRTR